MEIEYLARPTFVQWLTYHQDDQEFGELLKFIKSDGTCWPMFARQPEAIMRHLRAEHFCATSIEARFRAAVLCYVRDLSNGGKVPRRYGPPKMPDDERKEQITIRIDKQTLAKLDFILQYYREKDGSLPSRSRGISAMINARYIEEITA